MSIASNPWPERLHHAVPGWADGGSIFHIRLRVASGSGLVLTDSKLAPALIECARYYHEHMRWHMRLFLVMPDHIHILVGFYGGTSMAKVIGSWKRYVAKVHGIAWQTNFFDRRIRTDKEETETWCYILRNPVVKGLCATEEDWPWTWKIQ